MHYLTNCLSHLLGYAQVLLLFLLALLAGSAQQHIYGQNTKQLLPKVFEAEFAREALSVATDSPAAVYRTPIRGQFLYDNTAKIFGQIAIGRMGILGRGLVSVEGSLARGSRMRFLEREILCPRGKFIVKSRNPSKPVLEVNDVNIKYDLDQKMAFISPVGEEEFIEFPNHHYILGFHEFSWPFTEMNITVDSKLDSMGVPFPIHVRSLNPAHKGLAFNGTSFNYTFEEDKIRMGGVVEIPLRDIIVMPADSLVTILPDGTIDTLRNAKVRFKTPHPYMKAESSGDIVIRSKEYYSGLGAYEFINYKGERFSMEIKDAELAGLEGSRRRPDLDEATISLFVSPDSAREIIPGFLFAGLIRLSTLKNDFEFNGRVAANLPESKEHWFPYQGIGGEGVSVEQDMKLADGYVLQNGLYLGEEDGLLYPLFMEKDGHKGAFHLIEGYGALSFNPDSNRYTMHHQQVSRTGLMQEQYYSYNPKLKRANFSGAIHLNDNTENITVNSSAIGSYDASRQLLNCRATIELSMRTNRRPFDVIAKAFSGFDPMTFVDDPKPLYQNLRYFVPAEEMDVLERTVGEDWNLLSFFVNSIVLSDVELHWSGPNQAFYSKGDIAISNFFKSNVNARVEGFVYIPMKEGREEMHFYLKGKGEQWYYFKRKGDFMYIWSTNEEINEYYSNKDQRIKLLPEEEALKMIEFYREEFGSKLPR